MSNVDKRLLAARLTLSVTHPYFSAGLWLMRFYETALVPTMGITKNLAVAYNSEFLDELSQDEIVGVLLHELMHCLRCHVDRKLDRHPQKWNIAGDIEINDWLIKDGFTLPTDCCFAEKFGLDPYKTAEEYYELLPEGQQPVFGVGSGDCGSGAGGEEGEWEKEVCKQEKDLGDAHVSDVDVDLSRDEIAKAIRAHQKSTGNVPGGFLRWAEERLGPPQINWRKELAYRIRRAVTALKKGVDDYSYLRPSRRLSVSKNVIFPAMIAGAPPHVGVIVDTSGSIDQDELVSFLSEMQGILQSLGTANLRVISCDASVHSDVEVSRISDLKDKILGCGGTDLREGFKALDDKNKPEIVIVFTDGETPWPDSSPFKRTLVVLTKNANVQVPKWFDSIKLN